MTPKARAQEALDALGRLSCKYHEKNESPSRDEMVLYELDNFLKYTDLVHSAILAAVEKMEKK